MSVQKPNQRQLTQPLAHLPCSCCGLASSCQVMREVTSFLKMLDEVYGIFGLDYTMALSTRPESYLGESAPSTAPSAVQVHS